MGQIKIRELTKTAFRENFKPGLFIQGLALLIVLLYYNVEPVRSGLGRIGEWKHSGGILFSSLLTAFLGGLVPFMVLHFSGRIAKRSFWGVFFFSLLFWAYKGMEIDLFYRLQAALYGDRNHWWTVFRKVMTDQLLYVPFWALPSMTLLYLWKDSHFSLAQMKKKLQEESLFHRIVRLIPSNYLIWIPTITLVYNLPLDLQLPIVNLIMVFWTLILNSISEK